MRQVAIFRINLDEPNVEPWFAGKPGELGGVARRWLRRMTGCGDDVGVFMHDGCPVACLDDAPFGYVNAFTAHVNVGFFYGALLPDPRRIQEGTGKRMRHVKIRPAVNIDAEALGQLVDAAYADLRSRLAAAPRSP